MRNVRQMARQAYDAIDEYAKKKKNSKPNDDEIETEDPQVQNVERQGQSAEFQYDAAQDAADRAWSDTRTSMGDSDAGDYY